MARADTLRAYASVALLCGAMWCTADESWNEDPGWLSFTTEHEALFIVVHKFTKKLRRSDSISLNEFRRWNKLLSLYEPHQQAIMRRMKGHLRKTMEYDKWTGIVQNYGEVDEIVVIGRLFDHFPMDPSEFSFHDILGMRGIRGTANELYREGKYDQAYPLLLALAKRGFKDSQSRLAYILFTGTEEINKSNLRALGWLGTAAHGESEPMFRVLFNRYMNEVPASVMPTVSAVIDGYRSKYDSSEHVDCTTNHRFNSGVVKRTHCQFNLEAKVEACKGKCAVARTNLPNNDSF